jgi:DNA-binding MarR family transcriptional regulator
MVTQGDAELVDRLFELAFVLTERMNDRLAESGLTPARAELLWLLHHRRQLTHRQLSDILDCTPRNVTGLVDALQDAGLVSRQRDPADRRAVLVALTARGKALLAGWSADRDDGIDHLFAGSSRAELATFATVLERVLAGLRPGP